MRHIDRPIIRSRGRRLGFLLAALALILAPLPAGADQGPDGPPGMAELFDPAHAKVWQYLRPVVLLRTGAVWEQFDETSRVFRQAGFKLWDARLGFSGRLDPVPLGGWTLHVRYLLSGDFNRTPAIKDGFAEAEATSPGRLFAARLRLGATKVPFLYGELESDEVLYFADRPQYVAPYASSYLTGMVSAGLGRQLGATLRLAFLDSLIAIEGGGFTSLGKPKEETWETALFTVRGQFDSKAWFHERVRLQAGGGFFHQRQMPLVFENRRYGWAADGRLTAFGAFVGGEWTLHILDDVQKAEAYRQAGYENSISRAMGYQVFAGYSFPKREYEIAVRYQWWDPDDTNLEKPLPQSANQARRWITVGASWWPWAPLRLMLNYTHRQELEAVDTDAYPAGRLKSVDNDEVVLLMQVAI